MEILVGWLISYLMGAGWLYVIIFVFALAYPRLFRVLYWMLMLPIMSLGSAPFIWLFLGFFMGWNSGTFSAALFLGAVFGLTFCMWTDPKQAS